MLPLQALLMAYTKTHADNMFTPDVFDKIL